MTKTLLLLLLVVLFSPFLPFLLYFPNSPSSLHHHGVNGLVLLLSPRYNDDQTNGANETNGESSWDRNTRTTTIATITRPRYHDLLFCVTGNFSLYDLPIHPVTLAQVWPAGNSFPTSDAWVKMDASNNHLFYLVPRITYRIDEATVYALTRHH